jgi:hypothetical protein
MLKAVNVPRFKFPSHNGVHIRVTRIPGLHHQARRINFEILAFHAKLLAVTAKAFAEPFSPGPKISL